MRPVTLALLLVSAAAHAATYTAEVDVRALKVRLTVGVPSHEFRMPAWAPGGLLTG